MMDLKVKDEIMDSIFDILSKHKLTIKDIEIISKEILWRAEGCYYLSMTTSKKNTSEK